MVSHPTQASFFLKGTLMLLYLYANSVPCRIEIRFHQIEGQVYITGRPPRRRAWYANLLAHPEFTFHLKESIHADLPARATPILDQARRRAIITAIHQKRGVYQDVEAWVEHSPLVAVELLVP